jgi:CRP-like cAMP-binding protein
MKRKFWIAGGLVLLALVSVIALYQLPHNWFKWFKPDYLVDLSSLLTLISFTARSMVLLRFLAIGAQLTFIPYCFLQPTPLWTPIFWNLLFMVVNIANLVILMLENRPIVLNADEQKLYNLAFKTLKPREFLALVRVGEFRDGASGETIIVQDEQSPHISILIDGQASIYIDQKRIKEISKGRLLGLESVLSGEPQLYGISFDTPSRHCRWSVIQLRNYIDKRPHLREKLRNIVSDNLLKTLRDFEDQELKTMRGK